MLDPTGHRFKAGATNDGALPLDLTSEAPCLTLAFEAFLTYPKLEKIGRFLDYWLELRKDRLIPGRSALDPVAITWVMPNIWISEYEPEGDRFRMRLAGENVNGFYGRSITGEFLTDILPDTVTVQIRNRFRRVREEGCLFLDQGDLISPSGGFCRGERLVAPLAEDGKTVDHVIGVTIVSDRVAALPAGHAPETKCFVTTPV